MVVLIRSTCKVLQVRYNRNMTSAQRAIKRIIIIIIYLLIFTAVATAVYFLIREKPTCNDQKKNQGEEKVDCGGPCAKCETIPEIKNIKVLEKKLVPAGPERYDTLVKVENPNSLFGISNFEYSIDYFDGSGKIISAGGGSSFLLPAETKYIFAFNLNSNQRPAHFEFRIKSFKWSKFTGYEEPDFPVLQKEFSFTSGGSGFAELKAKFQNKSGYDFRKVTTIALIRNEAGEPVAINETNSNDVRVNEEREVVFRWTEPFDQNIDVSDIKIFADVNVFEDDNFMKKHGSPEQYESYGIDSTY